jgi:hypothetical protein
LPTCSSTWLLAGSAKRYNSLPSNTAIPEVSVERPPGFHCGLPRFATRNRDVHRHLVCVASLPRPEATPVGSDQSVLTDLLKTERFRWQYFCDGVIYVAQYLHCRNLL